MNLTNHRIKILYIVVLVAAGLMIFYDLFISNIAIKYFTSNMNLFSETDNRNNYEEIKRTSMSHIKSTNLTLISPKIPKCNGVHLNKTQFKVKLDGITYPNIVPLYHNRSLNFECLNSSKSMKTILMWTKFKGTPLVDYGFGKVQPFEKMNCPVTNCELTDDRNDFNVSDLVLFHLRNKIDYFPSMCIF